MYLFERAYIDYLGRLTHFGRWFLNTCVRVWQCFWRGRGANVIEMLLRVCVVTSGIAFGALYVVYEKSHGRSFSAGTVFAFVLIAVYVTVLMWGWKAPVHIMARAAAGAVASGAILLLAIGSMVTLLVFFALYLFLLSLLTALSFVVFLPILGYQKLKRWGKGITFECGYDQCPTKRGKSNPLPVHICECGAEYSNLYPNFYGIQNHVCRHPSHPGGEKKLPTSDSRGRNKLRRKCSVCEGELIQTELGLVAPHSVFVVGDTGSGKTVFIAQAVRRLCERLSRIPDAEARIGADIQKEQLDEQCERLDKGQVLAASIGTVMEGLGVVLRVPNILRNTLLYLYDAPGEHFQTMSRFGQKQAIQNAKGVVLIADPLTMGAVSGSSHADAEGSPFSDIAGNLANTVSMLENKGGPAKSDIPLAVVLTKCDELRVDGHSLIEEIYETDAHNAEGKVFNQRCRQTLQQLAGANAIQTIEQKFSNVNYFACSALGRDPDTPDSSPFEATRVVEPLLWLLGLDRNTGSATSASA